MHTFTLEGSQAHFKSEDPFERCNRLGTFWAAVPSWVRFLMSSCSFSHHDAYILNNNSPCIAPKAT